MQQVLFVIVPIFALIALGWISGRAQWIGGDSAKGLADFAFTLAIPAMLFRTMVTADLAGVEIERIWLAFYGSAFLVWLIAAVITHFWLGRPPQDGVSISMSAAFGNVVMLGIPLSLITFGPEAAAPGAVIVSLHSPILWIVAALHLAWAERGDGVSLTQQVGSVARDVFGNVVIVSIMLGVAWRFTDLGLHPIIDQIIKLLAQAAIPAALVGLGLSLVSFEIKGQTPTLSLILVLKMIVMPVAAFILAVELLALPPITAGVVILFASMPTGANAYLFAARHNRAVNSASGSIALGTLLSVLSATVIVYILKQGY